MSGMNHTASVATLLASLLTLACSSTAPTPEPEPTPEPVPVAAPLVDPWTAAFEAPRVLVTPSARLEPLGPQHAELDHAAFMSSREHLHATLHWGSWPRENTTVEENRGDLERHAKEFTDHEAYAYTVLSHDGERCLGCVYIDAGPTEGEAYSARVAYWVVADELANDLDAELVASLLTWFETAWPFATVTMPLHIENERGAEIARTLGMTEAPEVVDDHRGFTWSR